MRWSTEATSPVSIAALVVSNLAPLFGVLFGGWSLLLLLMMYWIESGIVGAVNVAKMAMARGTEPRHGGYRFPSRGAVGPGRRLVLIPFFILHYGLFWVVHGVFVLTMPIFVGMGSTTFARPEGASDFGLTGLGTIEPSGVVIAVIGLAISHVIAFFVDYLGRGEYLTVTPAAQMFSVYGRVVVLHATVLVGAGAIAVLGTPLAALVVFVLGKIALDVALHIREHRRAQTPTMAAPLGVHAPGRTAPDS
jgi:hypothetical protein